MDKGTFVKNTVILTGASLALRGVGMVFRVYLAAKIGAQGMGLYQLITTVYNLFLTVATAGVGVAAGVTGLSPLVASGCNFAMTLLSLWLGRLLGRRLNRWSRLALPLSGLLLVGLGAWQLI